MSRLTVFWLVATALLAACGQPQPAARTAGPAPAVPAATPAAPAMPPAPTPATLPAADGPDARTALLLVAPYAAQLANAQALRADAQVQQAGRKLLSEATALEQGPATASLKPVALAVARLLVAAQRRAYPNLADPTQQLAAEAQALSGQPATAAEKMQHHQFAAHASDLLKQFIAQTPDAHH